MASIRSLAKLAFILFVTGTVAQAQSSAGPDPDRYIVKFKNGPVPRAALRSAGAELRVDLPWMRAAAAHVPAASVRALRNNPNVEYVERDQPRYPLSQSTPYGIKLVQADQISDSGAGDIHVCIIDSGYSLGHEDLPVGGVTGSSDSKAGVWSQDGYGHGTHVAGTIVALNNGLGVLGVLPNDEVNLHIVRVFGNNGNWAYSSDLIAAAQKCKVEGHANVISMSLGCDGAACASQAEQAQFDSLYAAGILSFAAAGNSGNTAISYPAGYASVISVGAVAEDKSLASFSQRNADVELVAPGVAVLSTVPEGDGFDVTVNVGGTGFEAAALEGSFQGSGAGALFNCAMGTATCTGATGKVCLIQRGGNTFAQKVANCKNGGGTAAVIFNNEAGIISGTLSGAVTTIPSVGVSQSSGALLVGLVGQAATVSVGVGNYDFYDGTSMATPHAAGVAALVWSQNPSWTNLQVRAALRATAEDLGTPGLDNSFGYGLVRANAALSLLNGTPLPTGTPLPPTATATPSRTGTPTRTATPSRTPTRTATATPTRTATRTPTTAPTPSATSSATLTLAATTVKSGPKTNVNLTWSPVAGGTIDVYRKGVLAFTTPDNGAATDANVAKGKTDYRVCRTGTATCSNTVTVTIK